MVAALKSKASTLAIALLLVLGNDAAAQNIPTIRVLGPPIDGYKAVYYGVASGLFRKYGINVKPGLVSNGAAAAAGLSAGATDVAFVNVLTVLQAHQHNVPMQFIAPAILLTPKVPATMALVLKDSPARTGRDLNEKILASSGLHDINSAAFYAWVDKTGGDWKTLHQIEVPSSAGASFLETHRADVVILNEPAVSQAMATGKVRALVNPFDQFGTTEAAGFAVLGTSVDQNRAAYSKFARAMHEASAYTNSHPQQTIDLVASYSGATPDVVARSVRSIDPDYLEVRNLQPLIDVCAKYGLIDKDFAAQEIISSAALRPAR